MDIRTDLAIEQVENVEDSANGIKQTVKWVGKIQVRDVEITNSSAAKKIGRPIGKYTTIECNKMLNTSFSKDIILAVKSTLTDILPKCGTILVVGVGNTEITSDALGPKTASKILATRHIIGELAENIGLKGLRSVVALSPGVLGQTGMEVKEILEGAISLVRPTAIIAVDALAARSISRLGNTIQISDTGIAPGSGIGNSRTEISQKALGVPCISIGIPTVVDAATLCFDLTGVNKTEHNLMIVTPKDIDMLIEKASDLLGSAINMAIQPKVDTDALMMCLG